MSFVISFGRVLFAVVFIVSGAAKLFDLSGTAQEIATKVVVPADLAGYAASLEAATSMTIAQMLAILAGAVEFVAGVLLAFNIGVRFFSVVLILFIAVATFYFHDFWNQTGPEVRNSVSHALKNLSLIGGLLVLFGHGRDAVEARALTYTEL
ncbi:MAG TPA: DoxX family protein [Xanthobacteraceae bacterium]|nr:DoxX family protein [Xanthobacteraceae bacterium]